MTTLVTDLRPGDIIRGTVHACPCCGVHFIARADARFCSHRCYMQAKRKEA